MASAVSLVSDETLDRVFAFPDTGTPVPATALRNSATPAPRKPSFNIQQTQTSVKHKNGAILDLAKILQLD